MAGSKYNNWLDQAISDTMPGNTPKPDFNTWRKEHANALFALKLRAQQKTHTSRNLKAVTEFGRHIMENKYTKIAVAGALIIGLLLLTQHLTGNQSIPEQPELVKTVDQNKTSSQEIPVSVSNKSILKKELKLAETLFLQNDIQGLIKLLQNSHTKTQITIADYLEKTGYDAAIPILQKLADKWQGQSTDNPFQRAIHAIKSSIPASTPQAEDPNKQITRPSQNKTWIFQPKGVFCGTITDAITNKPIINAYVDIWDQSTAATDEHGFYSFAKIKRSGSCMVKIKCKKYLTGTWHVIDLDKNSTIIKHFKFERGCQVDIKIVNEKGQPIDQVDVAASRVSCENNQIDLCKDQTDPNGRVIIGAIKPSEIKYRITAQHKDYAPEQVTLKLNNPDSVIHIKMILKKGIDITGYAEYGDGTPANNISILAKPNWWLSHYSTITSSVVSNGIFTLHHITPQSYNINVSIKDKNSEAWSEFQIAQTNLPLPEKETLLVRIAQKSPQSQNSISGRITWNSLKIPDQLEITASCAENNKSKHIMLLDQKDFFKIESLEPGIYKLTFKSPNIKTATIKNIPVPTTDLEVVLQYQDDPHVCARVISADSNKPINKFKARIIKLKSLHQQYYSPDKKWHWYRNGHFNIKVTGSGIYQVQVIADGYAPALSNPINTDKNIPIVIKLTKGQQVQGKVVNIKGEPIANAIVIPLSTAKGNSTGSFNNFTSAEGAVKTVSNGSFVFPHLNAGTETFKVTHPDYVSTIIKNINIIEGQTTKNINIVLSTGTTIQGFVYGTDGKPQPNVSLYAQDYNNRQIFGLETETSLGIAVTDANGFYQIDKLPVDQLCTINRQNSWRASGVILRSCITRPDHPVQLNLGGQNLLSGTIQINENPIANMRIWVSDPKDSYSQMFNYQGQTDSFGRFECRGIKGIYGIWYENPEKRGDLIQCAQAD